MPYVQRFNGSGSGNNQRLPHLTRYCNHALYDFRQNQHGNTSASKECLVPGGATNTIAWGDANHKNWYGDSTGMFATLNSGARFLLTTNVADAVSEVFCIARVKFRHNGTAHVLCRGRDGSGAGWSLQGFHGTGGGQMNAVTTSGGDALRQALDTRSFPADTWITLHYAYKSGAYVRIGDNGVWRTETTFTATGLRASTVGMGINKANNFNATGDFFARFVGVGTAIPNDAALMDIHQEILSNEQFYDINSPALLVPNAMGGIPLIAWF